MDVKKEVSFLQVTIASLQAQLDKIKSYVGDVSSSPKGSSTGLHRFKASSFSMSSHCDYCKSSVWGLSKSAGFICEGKAHEPGIAAISSPDPLPTLCRS